MKNCEFVEYCKSIIKNRITDKYKSDRDSLKVALVDFKYIEGYMQATFQVVDMPDMYFKCDYNLAKQSTTMVTYTAIDTVTYM